MSKTITIDDIKTQGYKLHHWAWTRGYITRRNKDGYIEPYKGKFGEGYIHHTPSWDSTQYHYVEYYVK